MLKYLFLGFILALVFTLMVDQPPGTGVESYLIRLVILTTFGTFTAWLLIEILCSGDNNDD